MTNTIAFLESNTTGSGNEFLRQTILLGCQPLLLSADPALYPSLPPMTSVMRIDTASGAATLAARLRPCALAGVLTTSSYYSLRAAELAEDLGLPGPDTKAVRQCVHKYRQRQTLSLAGVPQPGYRFCTTVDEALEAARALSFPLVLKPVEGSGKVGVSLTRNRQELEAWAGALSLQRVNERGGPVAPGFLVEEFFRGREFSIEVFHGRPVAIVQKTCCAPRFVEESHVTPPARLSLASRRTLEQLAVRAITALGLLWGPAHVEARLSSHGQAVIIEVNPRLAGGNIPQLVTHATGLNLIAETIQAATGHPAALDPVWCRAAAIVFVFARQRGTLSAVDGLEVARTLPGIQTAESYRQPGDPICLWGDFRDRVAYAIAVANTPLIALRRARAAAATIHLEIKS